jgi:hypothetical protein
MEQIGFDLVARWIDPIFSHTILEVEKVNHGDEQTRHFDFVCEYAKIMFDRVSRIGTLRLGT